MHQLIFNCQAQPMVPHVRMLIMRMAQCTVLAQISFSSGKYSVTALNYLKIVTHAGGCPLIAIMPSARLNRVEKCMLAIMVVPS